MNPHTYTTSLTGAHQGTNRLPLDEGVVYEWIEARHRLTLAFRSPTQRERRIIRQAECHLALLALPAGVFLLMHFVGLDWTAAICPAPAPPEGTSCPVDVLLRDALSGAIVASRQLALPRAFEEQLNHAIAAQLEVPDRRELLRQLASLRARYGPDRELLPLATARCLAEEPPAVALRESVVAHSPSQSSVRVSDAHGSEPHPADSDAAPRAVTHMGEHSPTPVRHSASGTAHAPVWSPTPPRHPLHEDAPQWADASTAQRSTSSPILQADGAVRPPADAATAELAHQSPTRPAEVMEGADEYISIPRAALLAGLAPATLRSQATRRKRSLRTTRIGGRGVVTTRRWLHEYLAQRDPRGSRHPLPASYIAP